MSTTLKQSTGQDFSKQRAPTSINPLSLEESKSNMGVASVSSKRRLESSDMEMISSPVPSKVPRKSEPESLDDKCSSEFLTTSILARTLLTSVHSNQSQSSSSPLDCLKSSLEALPAPTFLESLEELTGSSCSSSLLTPLSKLTTLQATESTNEVEFDNLLCAETVVTVLSPIDENECRGSGWNSNIPSTTMTTFDQVITKEENGKSYFNLGSSDTSLIAKKTSPSLITSTTEQAEWIVSGSNNTDYLDEASSSSSCESISSDDLFNSCEEYDDDDPSEDDEDEVRSYKQERSTVLHLSLCKLNSFRTQNCVEPSLHRSVLICNTLRQIEQEIRNEDEASKFLRTKEKLPSLWPTRTNNPNPRQQFQEAPRSLSTVNNNNNSSYLNSYSNDPPYSNTTEPPIAYDYNSSIDRPSQTPFHTASFEYPELPTNHFTELGTINQSPSSTILESDSGYAEDIDLSLSSPFYYSTAGPTLDYTPPNPSSYVTIPEYSTVELPITIDESSSTLAPLESLQVVLKSSTEISDISTADTTDTSLEISNSGSDSSSSSTDDSDESWAGISHPPSTPISFPQQETNCGMESLRKDYNFTNSNQYPAQISMDTLISDSYSST